MIEIKSKLGKAGSNMIALKKQQQANTKNNNKSKKSKKS